MSSKGIIISSGLFILFLFNTCVKDELKEPVLVNFEFSLDTDTEEGKFLKFDQGDLAFQGLEFEGDREAGQDVFFTSEFDDLEVDLDSRQASEEVSFDIPQGIYNRIEIRLGNAELILGPELVYTGIYNSIHDGDIPVRIEFLDIDPIEMIAESSNAGSEIVLNKDVPANAQVIFDPVFLFQVSNSRQLESADISMIDGQPIIIISKDSNTVIFNIIINRLERSVNVIFN